MIRSSRGCWRTWCLAGTLSVLAGSGRGDALFKAIKASIAPPSTGYLTSESATLNGLTYFFAYPLEGLQLWRTDGTSAGTGVIANLGRTDNFVRLRSFRDAIYFAVLKGRAETGQTRVLELWKSDGTVTGTKRIKTIDAVVSTSLASFRGELYFSAYAQDSGSQIWKTDGTTEGTSPVIPLQGAMPSELVPVGDLLFFLAPSNNPSQTEGLWRSDGTAAGTFLLADFATVPFGFEGTSRLGPNSLVDVGGIAFFVANDGVSGNELWRSDGTLSGTAMVKDINPGSASAFLYLQILPPLNASEFEGKRLLPFGGSLFFAAVDPFHGFALWKSDGTAAGTIPVKSINATPPEPTVFFNPSPLLLAVGPMFYFQANDGVSGSELWRSDGTESGTLLVRDIFPGAQGSAPSYFGVAAGRVFFSAEDPDHGRELWVSDGTNSGTALVVDVLEGPDSSIPLPLAVADEELVFAASDRAGLALWRTDGSARGTVRIRTLLFSSDSPPRRPTDFPHVLEFRPD